jgi:hypothetical protein
MEMTTNISLFITLQAAAVYKRTSTSTLANESLLDTIFGMLHPIGCMSINSCELGA